MNKFAEEIHVSMTKIYFEIQLKQKYPCQTIYKYMLSKQVSYSINIIKM